MGRLVARCLDLEPDRAEIRVVLETRRGVLVETLLDAGFTLLLVNPDFGGASPWPGRKDNAEDARICCLIALDEFMDLRKLIPNGQLAGGLRAIARDDERRLLNRLRIDLLATFPAALQLAGDELGGPVILTLLAAWRTHAQLAELDHDALGSVARSARHGWPERFAARVLDVLAAE